MGPASGLLARALETAFPREDLQLCRISYDILGVIAAQDSTVEVEVVRPGRTIEMIGARMIIGGRTAIRATGWRLATADTAAVVGGTPEPMPGPDAWPGYDISGLWSGGFIDSLDFRVDPASVPGHCRAWLRTPIDVVAGEPSSDLVRMTGLIDSANGIAARRNPREWMFPNTDLTVHYFRTPRLDDGNGWIGIDATSTWGPNGIGVTSAVLHDTHGPVGRSEQILTLRPIPTCQHQEAS
ncbi:thioesterase family protein [Microlunatus elymi]|uniref:Thioesterase family protein n=2 Tax=Microlunatus elymi TaxID=2596828 RepID=A0A516Q5N5_9ACTN|nr:thioesterase family protein [Microlunatus elymi]